MRLATRSPMLQTNQAIRRFANALDPTERLYGSVTEAVEYAKSRKEYPYPGQVIPVDVGENTPLLYVINKDYTISPIHAGDSDQTDFTMMIEDGILYLVYEKEEFENPFELDEETGILYYLK